MTSLCPLILADLQIVGMKLYSYPYRQNEFPNEAGRQMTVGERGNIRHRSMRLAIYRGEAVKIAPLSQQLTKGIESSNDVMEGDNLFLYIPKHIKQFTQHWTNTDTGVAWGVRTVSVRIEQRQERHAERGAAVRDETATRKWTVLVFEAKRCGNPRLNINP